MPNCERPASPWCSTTSPSTRPQRAAGHDRGDPRDGRQPACASIVNAERAYRLRWRGGVKGGHGDLRPAARINPAGISATSSCFERIMRATAARVVDTGARAGDVSLKTSCAARTNPGSRSSSTSSSPCDDFAAPARANGTMALPAADAFRQSEEHGQGPVSALFLRSHALRLPCSPSRSSSTRSVRASTISFSLARLGVAPINR